MPIADPPRKATRRGVRRQDTLNEIAYTAVEIMAERGAAGLTLSEVARRIGLQPPSLYKYFPSLSSIYDELFARGQRDHLIAMRDACEAVSSGLNAVEAAQEASCRWALANQALAQLMFWRPVPGFEPSDEAFAPSLQMVELFRVALRRAVRQGELGPGGASQDALDLIAIMTAGMVSQYLANEPGKPWHDSRFMRQLSRTRQLLVATFPPG